MFRQGHGRSFWYNHAMKITLGGLGGTGTSTVGRMLAQELGYEFMSGGNMFRQAAAEHGMTMEEFDAYSKENPDVRVDELLDEKMKKYGQEHDNFVLESKLGWWQVPDSLKILFVADLDERARRIMGDTDDNRKAYVKDDFETTKRKTVERNEVHRLRIKEMYGIEDMFDPIHYDEVVDTTKGDQQKVLQDVLEIVQRYS